MINSKVGDEVVFIPLVGILLKLGLGSSLGLALDRIAGRNGCCLGSNLPGLTASCISSSAIGLGGGSMAMSSKNVVIHSEIWHEVINVMTLWLSEIGSGACLAFNRVASGDGSLLLLSGDNPWLSTVATRAIGGGSGVVALGIEDIAINTEVRDGVILVPFVLVFLELIRSSSLSFALYGSAGGD